MDDEYHRGTVERYDFESGFGIVVPDEPGQRGEKYVLLRKALRDRMAILRPGTRVQFKQEIVPMGTLAIDVHIEVDESAEAFGISPMESGTIVSWKDGRFGFIKASSGKDIFFHQNDLLQTDPLPRTGMCVEFELVSTSKGDQAHNVAILDVPVGEAQRSSPFAQTRLSTNAPIPAEEVGAKGDARDEDERTTGLGSALLAQAILARDARNHELAAQLYRQGMTEAPTVQLILSYAAMEKNLGHNAEAMRVYEDGIKAFPTNAKLWEDAGALAASNRDYAKAIVLLEHALPLYKGQSKKQTLQWLGRVYYQRGMPGDLERAIENYEGAKALFDENGRTQLQASDILHLGLARIRTQHHRGALTYRLLTAAGCVIKRAEVQHTISADLLVEVRNQELKESYGITSGDILVRCMFQANVTAQDIDSFDQKVKTYGEAGVVDEQIALLVVASLNDNLQRVLFSRIDDRKKAQSAIVPVTQEEIEANPDAIGILRDVFNRWLYRRDLFSVNSPVIGRRFFGRDKQLAQLRDAIAHGRSCGIFGLRKVGKTSLLKETARRASESGDIVVFMDLLTVPADVEDARWVYWKVATHLSEQCSRLGLRMRWRLGQAFPDFLDIPKDFPVATAFDADITSLLNLLRGMSTTPRPKIVLLLDEIERLLPDERGTPGFRGFLDFLGYLRGVTQETSDFVVIVTGANASVAEIGQFDGRDNPVFNFFSEIYLPLLDTVECRFMIRSLGRGMGLTFSERTLALVYQLTGGHPFFARQLCSFVATGFDKRPLSITDGMVRGMLGGYIEFCGKDFVEITDRLARDYPAELGILTKLSAQHGIGTLDQFRVAPNQAGSSLKHLLGYQLIRLRGSTVSLSMDLLKIWLSRSGA